MQKRPLLRAQQTMAKKMEEDIPFPEGLTPDQQIVFKRLWRASK